MARKTTKEEVEKEPIESKPKEKASPVVVASYRVPEKKKNSHIVLYIAIVCFLLLISTIVLFITQHKTSKKLTDVFQSNVYNELKYLELSEKFNEISEKYDVLSEQYEEIIEIINDEDQME